MYQIWIRKKSIILDIELKFVYNFQLKMIMDKNDTYKVVVLVEIYIYIGRCRITYLMTKISS